MWKSIKVIESSDENVKKFVFTCDTAVAESVLYKYPTYEDRTVICCSTQSGCPVGCRFCGAGDHFVRSLTPDEIISQPVHLIESTGVDVSKINKLQIMFMSMGEPMHNFDNLSIAIRKLYVMYPNAALLISTSAPTLPTQFKKLEALSKEIPTIGLQFSVHESTDENRKKLIPSKTSTLKEISEYGNSWYNATGRNPFFNYCVHDKNDKIEDVVRLNDLFDPNIWQATLSVICERDESIAGANERQRTLAENFSNKMLANGYSVRVFNPSGQDDIGGGCGQLFHVQNWMKENKNLIKNSAGHNRDKVHMPV